MKSVFVYLIGEIVSKAIPLMIMPYLTRSLGVQGFGELTLYQTWIALTFIFLSYVQDAAIIRYIYFYGVRSVGLIVLVGRMYTIISAMIGLFIACFYENVFLVLVIACSLSQSLLKVEMTIQQGLKEHAKYIALLLLSSFLPVFFTILVFEYINPSVISRIISVIAANFLCVLFAYFLFSKRFYRFNWSVKRMKLGLVYIFTFSSPLIFNSLSTFCKGQFDRLLISQRFSISELGEYAAGFQLASIFLLLLLAISRASEPYCYELLKNKVLTLSVISNCTLKCIPFLMIFILLVYLIPYDLYLWFLGPGFDNVKIYVVEFVLAFSILGIYMFYSMYLNFYGKTRVIAYANVSSIVIYLILLFILSGLGIEFVAIATVISNLFLVLFSMYFCFKLKVD